TPPRPARRRNPSSASRRRRGWTGAISSAAPSSDPAPAGASARAHNRTFGSCGPPAGSLALSRIHTMNAPDKTPTLDSAALGRFVDTAWRERIVPQLTEYIAVPAKSPLFDPEWQQHGLIDKVVRDAAAWVEGRKVPGLTLE